jgi:hypothetical protein
VAAAAAATVLRKKGSPVELLSKNVHAPLLYSWCHCTGIVGVAGSIMLENLILMTALF